MLKMGQIQHFILVLFFAVVFSLDFRGMRGSRNAHSVYMRTLLSAKSPIKSAPDLFSQDRISKRRQDTCNALQGYDTKLLNNTYTHIFNDLGGSVALAWIGDGTGVLLALTTFQVPLFMLRFGQSRLYRSEDYGRSFKDVTDLINNTFISTDFGIAIGPENSGKVILTGDISGSTGSRIFLSSDFGNSFMPSDLPFNPRMQIIYNPQNPNVLVAVCTQNDLWLSENFGGHWTKIHDTVCVVKWGTDHTLFFSTNLNGSCSERGVLVLKKTTDYGRTAVMIAEKLYSFGLGGRFLFASIMTGTGMMRMIHVSADQGEEWNMAQLPPVGHEQFYSILAASDEMVYMHVDEPGDTGFGTIYVSDDRGLVYSKSLERHLYTSTGGDNDFTNITSLRGVFMTSVLADDGSVQTVVTFNQGGEWVPLKKPENSECDSTAIDKDKCSLHIHASYSISMKLNVPMLPLTEPSAVGLIIAHGSVGDAISVLTPDVYVSDDGGYTWLRALTGPHHYAILDSGGLLVAVEQNLNAPIAQVKFSTDEGQCWHTYNFTTEPLYFTGLASEPGARSMNVSIWGYRDNIFTQNWVSITIDFKELLTRDCGDDDYVQWLAHSDDISDPNDGCMLGYKERFRRLRKDSVCMNGHEYAITKQHTPCPCTLDDFLCDFGYYRNENSSVCLEQAELKDHDLEFCIHGKKEHLQTNGYRKIPGDKCEGGRQPERRETDMSEKCISNLIDRQLQEDGTPSHSAPIIATLIAILLISCVAGGLFVKKYICGGRFLVHRYSVLQHNAEANGIEGVDEPLDTDVARSAKNTFHEDSDEDLLD
ncbi:sortilin 1b [Electrophorus electricus]|uniref:sortilin 1b n=1 Tax=Electrophorus electricus TaxID=8005 RepID=UPI0015D02558|nr:sortilin 1b [Electrophorus electricus]